MTTYPAEKRDSECIRTGHTAHTVETPECQELVGFSICVNLILEIWFQISMHEPGEIFMMV
jgi:hypothetical protein